METSRTRAAYLLLLLSFIYIQLLYGLGSLGLVGPDEPRYAEVAKEMLRGGDYVTPRLSGEPWLEKPILYYWITALSFHLLGVNESSARLASALGALLGILAVLLVGSDWIGVRGGAYAALILSSCILYFSLARAASTDALLTGTLTAAWGCLYFVLFSKEPTLLFGDANQTTKAGLPLKGAIENISASNAKLPSSGSAPTQDNAPDVPLASGFSKQADVVGEFRSGASDTDAWWRRTPLAAMSYFFLGLSVLAKGPVGLILGGAVLTVFTLITRRFGVIKQIRIGLGVVVVILVAGPWYWLCYRANGFRFIEEFLLRQNLERFATDRYQHLQPMWFYFAVIFAGFFPWVFQLLSSARRFVGYLPNLRTDPKRIKELYLWLWVIVPLLFFSCSRAKLPGYILPIAPPMALLVAREFEPDSGETRARSSRSWFKGAAWFQALFICLLGAALPFVEQSFNIEIGPFVPEMQAIFIGVGVLGLILAYQRRVRALLLLYLTATAVMVVLIVNVIIPKLDSMESTRQLALRLRQEGFSDQPIFLLGLSRKVEYGLNYYLDTKTRLIYSEHDVSVNVGETFLLTPTQFKLASLGSRFNLRSQTVFQGQKILKLRLLENPLDRGGQAP